MAVFLSQTCESGNTGVSPYPLQAEFLSFMNSVEVTHDTARLTSLIDAKKFFFNVIQLSIWCVR